MYTSRESYYDLPIFEIDGSEYAIATNQEEATNAVKSYVKESIWSFNTDFIVEHTDLPQDFIPLLQTYQDTKYEDANELILKLINDLDEFVEDAISADGRGHYLAFFDNHEKTLKEMKLSDEQIQEIQEELGIDSEDIYDILFYRVS